VDAAAINDASALQRVNYEVLVLLDWLYSNTQMSDVVCASAHFVAHYLRSLRSLSTSPGTVVFLMHSQPGQRLWLLSDQLECIATQKDDLIQFDSVQTRYFPAVGSRGAPVLALHFSRYTPQTVSVERTASLSIVPVEHGRVYDVLLYCNYALDSAGAIGCAKEILMHVAQHPAKQLLTARPVSMYIEMTPHRELKYLNNSQTECGVVLLKNGAEIEVHSNYRTYCHVLRYVIIPEDTAHPAHS
jgi:hypothetical protein